MNAIKFYLDQQGSSSPIVAGARNVRMRTSKTEQLFEKNPVGESVLVSRIFDIPVV